MDLTGYVNLTKSALLSVDLLTSRRDSCLGVGNGGGGEILTLSCDRSLISRNLFEKNNIWLSFVI